MLARLFEKSPTARLRMLYIAALSTVAILSILGQVIIQTSLKQQSGDSRVINIAGRQRMLSQRLSKAALKIDLASQPKESQTALAELEATTTLWHRSHQGLKQGDATMDLPGENSATVSQMFADLEPTYRAMYESAQAILKLENDGAFLSNREQLAPSIETILANEASFLQQMDAIVFQYDLEASQRVGVTKTIELSLLALTLLVLLLEARFIFHPAIKQLQASWAAMLRSQEESTRMADILARQNRDLDLALQQAQSATRLKSEFLASMSHEIRTPMNAVIGFSGLLLGTPLAPAQKDYAETIRTSSEILLSLINDILDFSKIEAGKLDLEPQQFNLATCLVESLDLIASTAAQKELELVYLIDESVPLELWGDVTRVRQILVNLLSNAVKFTHVGEIVVSLTAQRSEAPISDFLSRFQNEVSSLYQIHCTVRDTGIGIPSNEIDRLFDAFSQLDAGVTRKYGGTGLGLAISKRLCQMMGGEIWAESTLGSGSTFHFTFLVLENSTTEDNPAADASLPLNNKRILVAENNASQGVALSSQLQQWGLQAQAVSQQADLLAAIQSQTPFDAAILDRRLVETESWQVLQQIRTLDHRQPLPIILTTPLGDEPETVPNEIEALLVKPIKPSLLLDTLMIALVGEQATLKSHPAPLASDVTMADRFPLKILLAEDNVVNQKVAVRLLERLGYRIDVVSNGEEAIAALRQIPYQVVFMDMQMPEMDGLEATRYICQEWDESSRPWIIAMTANAMERDRNKCLDAGMNDYVSKPVRLADLIAALQHFCGASPQEFDAAVCGYLDI